MKIFIALILFVASVSAYLDEPEDTRYFIKNVNTNTYLYVDNPYILPSGISVARNVCTLDIANKVPSPLPEAVFQLVTNNAIGPYYNIINYGTNSVLFASEIVVGTENNVTVNKVLAWKDTDHNNTPEALWNIRHFKNDLYILNVHYGAYLYTNDNKQSAAMLDRNRKVAMLMPTEDGGRVVGTQWLIISNARPKGKMDTEDEGNDGRVIAKPVENEVGGGAKEGEQESTSEEFGVVVKGDVSDGGEVMNDEKNDDQLIGEQKEKETVVIEGGKENKQEMVGVVKETVTGRENVAGKKAETGNENKGEENIEVMAVTVEAFWRDSKKESKDGRQMEKQSVDGMEATNVREEGKDQTIREDSVSL